MYCDVDPDKVPKYVKDTLSLGPNNSVQLGFDKKNKKELGVIGRMQQRHGNL